VPQVALTDAGDRVKFAAGAVLVIITSLIVSTSNIFATPPAAHIIRIGWVFGTLNWGIAYVVLVADV